MDLTTDASDPQCTAFCSADIRCRRYARAQLNHAVGMQLPRTAIKDALADVKHQALRIWCAREDAFHTITMVLVIMYHAGIANYSERAPMARSHAGCSCLKGNILIMIPKSVQTLNIFRYNDGERVRLEGPLKYSFIIGGQLLDA